MQNALKDKALNIWDMYIKLITSKEWQATRPFIMSFLICVLLGVKTNIVWLDEVKSGLVLGLVLLEIFKRHQTSNNTTINNKEPMQVQTLYFTNETTLKDALNRQFDCEYKVNMLIELYDDDIITFQDDEAENFANKYEQARYNLWRERKVKDYSKPTETEKFTIRIDKKTDEEYKEAKKQYEEALSNLKKHLKANI